MDTPDERSGVQRVRLRGVRQIIARRMALSHGQIPGVHIVEEVDATGVPMDKLLAVAVAGVAETVARHPYLNAHFDGQEIILHEFCNVGIAVDTPNALMVPVVTDCANKTVKEIHHEIKDLACRARTNDLASKELRGATITITSPGKRGGLLATPLINPPETAIVGLHRAKDRPVLFNGSIAIRRMMNITVTFDHRVIDGAEAGDFALSLVKTIEGSS